MRAASNLIPACIVCLLKCGVLSTAISNTTDHRALNLVSVSPRPETNTSASRSSMKSQDFASATKVIEHERSNEEERVWDYIKSAAMKIIDALHPISLEHPLKALEKIDVRAGQGRHIIETKLKQWIMRADKYNGPFPAFDDAAIVDSLGTKLNWEAKQLVELFASLRHSSGMNENRILALQKLLGNHFPLGVMLPLWRKSYFDSREVYQMMSIATDGLFTADGKETAAWADVKAKLICWIEDAEKSCGATFLGHYNIFNILAEFRQPEELLILFTSLPPGWEERADDFQAMLYKKYSKVRPKLAEIWLDSGKTPKEAYDLMPVPGHAILSAAVLEQTNLVAACDDYMERFLYTDKYMDRSIIFSMDKLQREEMIKKIDADTGDDAVAAQKKKDEVRRLRADHTVGMMLSVYDPVSSQETLVRLLEDEALAHRVKDRAIATLLWKRTGSADVAVFFHRLRSTSEMMSRADRMQQQLLNGQYSGIEKVVFGLWLNSGLNPEQVSNMMPFAIEDRFGPVVGRHSMEWRDFCTYFKQWLRYVALYYNGDKTKFDDGEVVRMLTKHVKKNKELMFLSSDLQTEPEWKELADLLKASALTVHE